MNKLLIGTVAVVLLAALGWYVFGQNSAPQSGVVTLGVIAGTTGQYAAAGEGYLKGFELAREQWNASHELKFNAVIEDDSFDSKKGLAAYKKLTSVDHPDAYAVVSTFTIDVIADEVTKAGTPVALGFEQSTQAKDDSIFQVLPAARPIQKGLGTHLKSLGYKKPLVVVSTNTSVYENFFQGFREGYGEGLVKEEIGVGTASPREIALKVQSEKPDIVVFFTAPTDGALVAKEIIRLQGASKLPFAFDQSIQSGVEDYKKVFGEKLADLEGSLVALSRNDLTAAFKANFKTKYAAEAPFAADMGYNAFMLLANTHSNDKGAWVANMKRAAFEGADGEVSFDAVGLRVPNIQFGVLSEGAVVLK